MRTHSVIVHIIITILFASLGCAPAHNDVGRKAPELLNATSTRTAPGDTAFVRVIDSGVGLSCVIVSPEGRYAIYDAGDFRGQEAAVSIREVIPQGSIIDLVVLSHTDADHLGAVDEIFDNYTVLRVIHGGWTRPTNAYRKAIKAIEKEEGCDNVNLSIRDVSPGTVFSVGSIKMTFVCGWSKPPETFGLGTGDNSETRNAASIVMRMDYAGRSILLTGDAIGRHRNAPDRAPPIATEAFMINNAHRVPIRADVLIAPHHGGDNASSAVFIETVQPQYVIFSSGHQHSHPRSSAVRRYLDAGIQVNNIFRTDLGDDEGKDEWNWGRIAGHTDRSGDDDVDIVIQGGRVTVVYTVEQ